ncbi:MAG: hypothetical protein ACXAEU_04755 [Candidatus Hodarchaeales archaeon]|jgi:signal transduction histidine kinase
MVLDEENKLELRKMFHDIRNDLMTLEGFLSLLQEELTDISGNKLDDITLYADKSIGASQRLTDRLDKVIDIIYRELELKLAKKII